jgi:gamma-glutamyltranspeptidase
MPRWRGEIYLNGGGKGPGGASLAALLAQGMSKIPLRGIVAATLTVPGAVASWTEAHRVHGRSPLARVLESRLAYAQDDFSVTARLAVLSR